MAFCVELQPGWFYGVPQPSPRWSVERQILVDCRHVADHRMMGPVLEVVEDAVDALGAVHTLAGSVEQLIGGATAHPLEHWTAMTLEMCGGAPFRSLRGRRQRQRHGAASRVRPTRGSRRSALGRARGRSTRLGCPRGTTAARRAGASRACWRGSIRSPRPRWLARRRGASATSRASVQPPRRGGPQRTPRRTIRAGGAARRWHPLAAEDTGGDGLPRPAGGAEQHRSLHGAAAGEGAEGPAHGDAGG